MGGEDASALMARHAGRVFAIHVKDIAPADIRRFARHAITTLRALEARATVEA